ncbi:MAG: STAS domain-containing protein [bacterium]|nr:STAS domain-containing protein [bacterium]
MNIEFKMVNNIGIVKVSGSLVIVNVEEFNNKFDEYLEENNNFILDLSDLEFIDSTGLGAIVSVMRKATQKGGDLKISCLSTKAKMVFEITHVFKIFDVFDTTEAAIEGFE